MKNKVRRTATIIIGALLSAPAYADYVAEATRLMEKGNYAEAISLLGKERSSNEKIVSSAQYNYLLGVCQFEQGDYADASESLEKARAKGNKASLLYLGRLAYLAYDFEKALELYDAFEEQSEKGKQPLPGDVESARRQLTVAENSLGRVEKIEILDSIAVAKDLFFQSYKLPRSAGRLEGGEELKESTHQDTVGTAFINEGDDFMIWSEPDSLGNLVLLESIKLTDGEWHSPTSTPSLLGGGGNAAYPFMMPDGVTLYYASDGEESMGGYDIFVASRNPQTGEFLQPQNIGMPYNSPFDDYMLAIDEENGLGWWASDRNLLDDKITVYLYKVNELRKNYNPDDEDIVAKAKISEFELTQDSEKAAEYAELLETVDNINPDEQKKKADFYFPRGNGTYYTSFADFSSGASVEAMKKYLEFKKTLREDETRLDEMRRNYHEKRSASLGQEISSLEKKMEKARQEELRLRSNVYKIENKGR